MNKSRLTPEVLVAKAETASSSALALLERGDIDAAANRAYYAVFDAARAALARPDPGRCAHPDVGHVRL